MSTPALRNAASCSRQCVSGPVRHTASRIRSLSDGPPTPFSIWSASGAKPLARNSRWKNGGRIEAKVRAGCFAHRFHIVTDERRKSERDIDLAEPRRLRPTPIGPRLALFNAVSRPQKRHDAIRELARDLDGARMLPPRRRAEPAARRAFAGDGSPGLRL